MKNQGIKSMALRNFMIFLMCLIILATIGGFYITQDWLKKFVNDVNLSNSQPNTSLNAKDIKDLQKQITDNKASIDKSTSLFVSSQSYKNIFTRDINKYASVYNIEIKSISQQDKDPYSNLVTIKNPVKFKNLMLFIKSIETNIPKMQITGITLSRYASDDTSVTVDPLTIKVFGK